MGSTIKSKILLLAFVSTIPTVLTFILGIPGLMIGALLAFATIMEVLKEKET